MIAALVVVIQLVVMVYSMVVMMVLKTCLCDYGDNGSFSDVVMAFGMVTTVVTMVLTIECLWC